MKWISDIDCGCEMLRCENCDARVIADHYKRAVGLAGYSYCPYCGTKLDSPKWVKDTIGKFQIDCSLK